jgi:hypothetical protein
LIFWAAGWGAGVAAAPAPPPLAGAVAGAGCCPPAGVGAGDEHALMSSANPIRPANEGNRMPVIPKMYLLRRPHRLLSVRTRDGSEPVVPVVEPQPKLMRVGRRLTPGAASNRGDIASEAVEGVAQLIAWLPGAGRTVSAG